jgi:PAS domain S-box-containing protein
MIGKNVQEILGREHFDHRKPFMDVALAGNEVKFNMTFNHYSLGLRNTEQIYHPDVSSKGKIKGFLAIVYDVTDQRRAEKAAKDNETLFRNFAISERKRLYSKFMQAPIGISVLSGPDHVVEMINDQARHLFGDRDVKGMPTSLVLPELYTDQFKEMLDEIYLSGEGKQIAESKISIKLADGAVKSKYLNLFYRPWKDEDGKIIGILNIALDVTEKVRASKAVEEKEELFRTYAESMPQMAFIANSKGDMTYFNQRWFDYTALNFKDSKDWSKSPIHEEDFAKAYTLWQESVASGKPYQIEFRIKRADGAFRWHLARAVPIRNSRGRITQWVGTKTDIHDQKQAKTE